MKIAVSEQKQPWSVFLQRKNLAILTFENDWTSLNTYDFLWNRADFCRISNNIFHFISQYFQVISKHLNFNFNAKNYIFSPHYEKKWRTEKH